MAQLTPRCCPFSRLGSRWAGLVLLGVSLALSSCNHEALEGTRPTTPRKIRLNGNTPPALTPLADQVQRPARRFLTPAVIVRPAPSALVLYAPVDGVLDDNTQMRWDLKGYTSPQTTAAGERLQVRQTHALATASVALLHGNRELDRIHLSRALPSASAPWIVAGQAVAVVSWRAQAGKGLRLEVQPKPGSSDPAPSTEPMSLKPATGRHLEALLASDREGGLLPLDPHWSQVSVRWVDPVTGAARSPWATATPASLPSAETQRVLPAGPHDCADEDFPRWGPGGLLSCSGAHDDDGQYRVDLFIPERAGAPVQTIQLPALATTLPPAQAPPTNRAWVSSGLDSSLIWASEVLGIWGPGSTGTVALARPGFRGRAADDGRNTAFGRSDRVEVTRRGSAQRTQLNLQPADHSAVLALASPWLAAVTGPPGQSQLELEDLNLHARISVAGPADVLHPVLAGSWLSWTEEGAVHTLPLSGGQGAVVPLSTGFGSRAIALDDFRLDEVRDGQGVDVWATHLPTGSPLPVWEGPGDQRLRGGGGGRLVAWTRSPEGADALQLRSTPIRVLEEDGACSHGDRLQVVDGGHGGRSGRLGPGQTRTLRFDPGPSPVRIEVFVNDSAGEAQLELRQGSSLRRITGLDPGSPARAARLDGPTDAGRWVPFPGILPSSVGSAPSERQVELQITAGGTGFVVDAIRIIEMRP